MKKSVAKFILLMSMVLSAYSIVGAAVAHEPRDGMPVPTCSPGYGCSEIPMPMPK